MWYFKICKRLISLQSHNKGIKFKLKSLCKIKLTVGDAFTVWDIL